MRICSEVGDTGLEPVSGNCKPVDNKALAENQNPVLATGLDKILQKYPDLALVVERWPKLPEHIKTAIKTLVEKAGK